MPAESAASGCTPRRQRETNRGALARLALDGNLTAATRYQRMRQRQAQTRAAFALNARIGAAEELGEQPSLIFATEANARVADTQHDGVRLATKLGPDFDLAAFGGVLHGVADQVADRLAQQQRYGLDWLQLARRLDRERLLLLLRQGRQVGDHLIQDRGDLHRLRHRQLVRALELAQLQQILHQSLDGPAGALDVADVGRDLVVALFERGTPRHLCVRHDERQRVAQLMGDQV